MRTTASSIPASRSPAPGHDPEWHRRRDRLQEGFLLSALVLSTWVLAGEPAWMPWILGTLGLAVGALSLTGRRRTGLAEDGCRGGPRAFWVRVLAGVSLFLLLWVLVSALNAGGTVGPASGEWIRRSYLAWLPHSYDSGSTWRALWQGLGIAGFFWGTRSWLLTDPSGPTRDRAGRWPSRGERLIWVVSINGALLAGAGLLQLASGTPKLLGLFEDPAQRAAATHFGPFAYRNNAAQYLQLIWPLTFALWLIGSGGSHHRRRVGSSPRMLLPVLMLLMVAGILGTTSKGGGLLLLCTAGLAWGLGVAHVLRGRHWLAALALVGFLAAFGALAVAGWPAVQARLMRAFFYTPLDRPEGFRQCTLAIRFTLPDDSKPRSGSHLLGLSEDYQHWYRSPYGLVANIDSGGTLVVDSWGSTDKERYTSVGREFWNRFRGRAVDLVLIYDGDVRVFANGEPLVLEGRRAADQAPWPDHLAGGGISVGIQKGEATFAKVAVWDSVVTVEEATARLHDGDRPGSAARKRPLWEMDLQDPSLWRIFANDASLFGRVPVWKSARATATHFAVPPALGLGPGTYSTLYGISPARIPGLKELHVHNDYLEVWLTFGAVGAIALFLGMGGVLALPFTRGGIACHWESTALLYAAMLGCLAFAVVDWPLQAPAVRLLLVVLAAMLSCTSFRAPPQR